MHRNAAAVATLVILWGMAAGVALADGGGAAAYLKMGVGARALGSGGAFTGVADDATAIFWNPAGMVQLDQGEVVGMHANLTVDRAYDFLGYAGPMSGRTSWGFGYTRFSIDGIPETRMRPDGINPVLVDDVFNPDGTLQTPGSGDIKIFSMFGDTEDNFTFGMATRLAGSLRVGANVRFLQQSLAGENAIGFGLDVGALYKVSNKLSLGLSVRDLFEKLDFGGDLADGDVPVTATLGAAYGLPGSLRFSADMCQIENEDAMLRVGAEKWFQNRFALRMGSNDGDLAAGASVRISDWRFDYAYQAQELGDQQRLSFAKRF